MDKSTDTETMHYGREDNCSSNRGQKSIELYKYENVPMFLQRNQYIWAGYRKDLSPEQCLNSICMWTNETINIWSHLVSSVVIFFLIVDINVNHLPVIGGDVWDHVITSISLLILMHGLLASTGYHTFNCLASDRACCKWLLWDLNGIAITIYGVLLSAVYYMFYCEPLISVTYIAIGLCIVYSIIHSSLYFPARYDKTFEKMILKHQFKITGMGVFSLLPVMHFVVDKGWSNEYVNVILPIVFKTYIILISGATIFVLRFPECMFPGKVDYLGGSHNWWHVIIFLCPLYWFLNLYSVVENIKLQECPLK